MTMQGRIVELHGAAEIAGRVGELASEINARLGDRGVTVLCVSEDGFVFLADLLRALRLPSLSTSFLRYEHRSRGGLEDLSFETPVDVSGRDVLLVAGVLDTGVTHEYLSKQLEGRGAASVRLCVLVDKPERRRTGLRPEWRAFEASEEYVFGYGLGLQGRWRELPYLATFERPADGASGKEI